MSHNPVKLVDGLYENSVDIDLMDLWDQTTKLGGPGKK